MIAATLLLLTACTSTPVVQKDSTVEQQIKCADYGKENYKDQDFDNGYIKFSYYYSPKLDTCILQREEFGPEPTQYVYKLYETISKKLLLHYATFEGIGCAAAEKCVHSLDDYNKEKDLLLK